MIWIVLLITVEIDQQFLYVLWLNINYFANQHSPKQIPSSNYLFSLPCEYRLRQGYKLQNALVTFQYSSKASQTQKSKLLSLQQQQKIIEIMRNHSQELYDTSDSQTYHFQLQPQPFLSSSDLFTNYFITNYPHISTNETLPLHCYNLKIDQEFKRMIKDNIVLPTKNEEKHAVSKQGFNHRSKENNKDDKKLKLKTNQKESRNVYSNVLRIFFKCVLQMGTYDTLINRILQKSNFAGRREDFYAWLLDFNINFKNYIRSTQLKRILIAPGHVEYKKTLMIVLRHYLNNHAVSHCLTSKRIELSSLKMHLSGLKELHQEATKMKLSCL